VYFGSAARLVHAAIAHWNFALMRPLGGTIPGHGAFPRQEHDRQEHDRQEHDRQEHDRQEHDRREPNMRGLELTGRPGAVR